jgi:acetolactate decarboxylase
MKELRLKLSSSLWAALEERQRTTGEPIHHIARAALADYLQVNHQTLFQVSTSGALVEGVYGGAVTIGELRKHGDFGLGTFEGLDGEMIALDGRFYQVRSDGTVHEAADSDCSPFAVVTHFSPDERLSIRECRDLGTLCAQLDTLRVSSNVFYAIRVTGPFAVVHTRAMCRTAEGVPLVVAAAHQPEFRIRDVRGTLVGFWSPEYAGALEVPGYHLHFLTEDCRAGGHVLGCDGHDLDVQVQRVNDLRLALPENEAFLQANLRRDPAAALDKAERSSRADE